MSLKENVESHIHDVSNWLYHIENNILNYKWDNLNQIRFVQKKMHILFEILEIFFKKWKNNNLWVKNYKDFIVWRMSRELELLYTWWLKNNDNNYIKISTKIRHDLKDALSFINNVDSNSANIFFKNKSNLF